MKQDNTLQVYYDERLVGTLAMTANRKAAFQYSDEWLEHGFSISPFSLPLKKQVFVPTKDPGLQSRHFQFRNGMFTVSSNFLHTLDMGFLYPVITAREQQAEC